MPANPERPNQTNLNPSQEESKPPPQKLDASDPSATSQAKSAQPKPGPNSSPKTKPRLKPRLYPEADIQLLIDAKASSDPNKKRTLFFEFVTQGNWKKRLLSFFHAQSEALGPEVASDLADDTLEKAFRSLHKWDPDYVTKNGTPGKFDYWILSKARSELKTWSRKSNRFCTLDPYLDNVDPASFSRSRSTANTIADACNRQPTNPDAFEALKAAARRLQSAMDPMDAKVFDCRYVEGHSIKETAFRTGQTIDQVHKRVRRIKQTVLDTFAYEGRDIGGTKRKLTVHKGMNRLKRDIVACKGSTDWKLELGDRLLDRTQVRGTCFSYLNTHDHLLLLHIQTTVARIKAIIHPDLQETLVRFYGLNQGAEIIAADHDLPHHIILNEAKKIRTVVNKRLPGDVNKSTRFVFWHALMAMETVESQRG